MSIPKINLSGFSKIFKSKILIVCVALLVLISVGIIVVSSILTSNKRKAAAVDFGGDLPVNLDEVFPEGTNAYTPNDEEQKEIDTVLESINTNKESIVPGAKETEIAAAKKAVNIDMTNLVSQDSRNKSKTTLETDLLSYSSDTSSYSDNSISFTDEAYNDSKPIIEETENKIVNAKKVSISSFIIDSPVATREKPTYITIAVKAAKDAVYLKVRVYARKLNKRGEPITRSLIFALPKVYVINGQSQTQFYWAGRTFMSQKYVSKGKYILYTEIEAYDKYNKRVGTAGRYSLPKMDNVITLK